MKTGHGGMLLMYGVGPVDIPPPGPVDSPPPGPVERPPPGPVDRPPPGPVDSPPPGPVDRPLPGPVDSPPPGPVESPPPGPVDAPPPGPVDMPPPGPVDRPPPGPVLLFRGQGTVLSSSGAGVRLMDRRLSLRARRPPPQGAGAADRAGGGDPHGRGHGPNGYEGWSVRRSAA